jgi:hypothetical protein
MIKPTVTELHHSGKYALVESFNVDQMGEFLAREAGLPVINDSESLKYQSRRGKFWVLIIVSILIGGYAGYYISDSGNESTSMQVISLLKRAFLSIPFLLLIVLPLHEGIHALFFRLIGAKEVGFGYSLKSVMVYAYAHRFVMTLKENALVAIMPFAIITPLLLWMVVIFPEWATFWLFTLLFHTFGSLGDFIMVRYYLRRRHQQFFTYDDIIQKRSYFFTKIHS